MTGPKADSEQVFFFPETLIEGKGKTELTVSRGISHVLAVL